MPVCMCMCVCILVCAHTCVGTYAHVCTCVWRSKVNIRQYLQSSSILLFETGTFTEPQADNSTRRTGQQAPGAPRSHLYSAGSSWLCGKCLTDRAIYLVPWTSPVVFPIGSFFKSFLFLTGSQNVTWAPFFIFAVIVFPSFWDLMLAITWKKRYEYIHILKLLNPYPSEVSCYPWYERTGSLTRPCGWQGSRSFLQVVLALPYHVFFSLQGWISSRPFLPMNKLLWLLS